MHDLADVAPLLSSVTAVVKFVCTFLDDECELSANSCRKQKSPRHEKDQLEVPRQVQYQPGQRWTHNGGNSAE